MTGQQDVTGQQRRGWPGGVAHVGVDFVAGQERGHVVVRRRGHLDLPGQGGGGGGGGGETLRWRRPLSLQPPQPLRLPPRKSHFQQRRPTGSKPEIKTEIKRRLKRRRKHNLREPPQPLPPLPHTPPHRFHPPSRTPACRIIRRRERKPPRITPAAAGGMPAPGRRGSRRGRPSVPKFTGLSTPLHAALSPAYAPPSCPSAGGFATPHPPGPGLLDGQHLAEGAGRAGDTRLETPQERRDAPSVLYGASLWRRAICPLRRVSVETRHLSSNIRPHLPEGAGVEVHRGAEQRRRPVIYRI